MTGICYQCLSGGTLIFTMMSLTTEATLMAYFACVNSSHLKPSMAEKGFLGLERRLREHLQRTWFGFLTPHGGLQRSITPLSGDPNALFQSMWAPGMQVLCVHAFRQIIHINLEINDLFTKVQNKKSLLYTI